MTAESSDIHDAALEAMYALKRLSEALDAFGSIGARIDIDEYAQLVQLEQQWCSTCQKIVLAEFEAWKKNQPGEEGTADDVTT